MASTLIGIVIARISNVSGAFDKSIHINKSERPLAFSTLTFKIDRGVNILAMQ